MYRYVELDMYAFMWQQWWFADFRVVSICYRWYICTVMIPRINYHNDQQTAPWRNQLPTDSRCCLDQLNNQELLKQRKPNIFEIHAIFLGFCRREISVSFGATNSCKRSPSMMYLAYAKFCQMRIVQNADIFE